MPITVVFNEPVDIASLSGWQSLIQVTPAPTSLELSLGSDLKTLSIIAHPFLSSGSTCVATMGQGLKDAAGGSLSSTVTWSFKTASDVPAADVQFAAGKYTNASSVGLNIFTNSPAGTISLADTQAELATAVQSFPATGGTTTATWQLNASLEGPQTVWVQYETAGGKSTPRSATVIRDVTPPQITAFPSSPVYFNASLVPVIPTVTTNDPTAVYSWASVPASGFNPSDTSPSPAITPSGVDGDYVVTLTVTDPAGNFSKKSFTITKDTVPPGTPAPPGVVNPQTATTSLTPTWQYPVPDATTGSASDVYVVQLNAASSPAVLESRTIPLPNLKDPSWSPQAPLPGDGIYVLTVWQMDLAGNKSIKPYQFDFTVAPEVPVDGSTINGFVGVNFQWRPFGGGSMYNVHVGHLDQSGQFVEEGASGLQAATTWTFSSSSDHVVWYIEGGPGTRCPSGAGAYYSYYSVK